jgi:hypothetical protein
MTKLLRSNNSLNVFNLLRAFVVSEGLKKIQEIKAAPGSKLRLYIEEINSFYPREIVEYYSPEYAETLMKR